MAKGRVAVYVDVFEVEYDPKITSEILPAFAEFNDIEGKDNLALGLLPSRKGARIVLLHFVKE